MYSHFLDCDRYLRLNKGDKPEILAFLRGPHRGPWFAAVADSGQKHVVPWAPVNPPGALGRVLFEETIVVLPAAAGWALVDRMAGLLTAGPSKAEVEAGRYGSRAYTLCRGALESFERDYGHERGGAWFALALWLAQRDEGEVARREEGKGKRRGDA